MKTQFTNNKFYAGSKVFRWTLISPDKLNESGTTTHWNCICQCGKKRVVRASNLRRGVSHSCGCISAEIRFKSRINISGKRYGKLVVIRMIPDAKRLTRWECLCDCGNKCDIQTRNLRGGMTRSCGCLISESVRKRCTTHGRCGTALYYIWKSMRNRCNNPKNAAFKNYGGRGIRVCKKWDNSFEKFLKDVGERPSRKLTIERIDNDSGYMPSNFKWATRKEQAHNKRPMQKKKS